MPVDYAGNTLEAARELSITSTSQTFTDYVDCFDTSDFYRFTFYGRSSFNLSLTSLSADADVQLLNSNGQYVQSSTRSGTNDESINITLDAGTYYIQVYPYGDTNTYYNLNVFSTSSSLSDPGNTLGTAESQSSAIFSRNQQVSACDRDDFYSFTVCDSGIFTANLTELSGDADVRLIQDSNNNGQIDQGDVRAWQWERGTASESIRDFISAGTYFVQVMSYNNQTANYSLETNFTAATSDDRSFSIEVNFGQGTSSLDETLRNAVLEAARFWEEVISYSSFNGAQTLTINLIGEDVGGFVNGSAPLAFADWASGATDSNGRFMPTSGISGININSEVLNYLTSNVTFFTEVITHEFGHVLGIGGLWAQEGRDFVNFNDGTYSANTYAGSYYGELLGTYTQTAVPLTTGVGPGSDYAHWSEDVFDTELMTYRAESIGTPNSVSQLTIASLRDIGWYVNYGAAQPYSLPV